MRSRILIIENSTAITGALKSIARSSTYLSARYHFIFLLPKYSSARKYLEECGFEVYELPMKELRKSISSFLMYFPFLLYNTIKLFEIIRSLKIDLIIVNDFYNLLPALYKLLGGKLQYVCYVRFLPSKFPQPLVKFWCSLHNRYASSIIGVSEAVRRELPYQNKVIVIGNELPSPEVEYVPATSHCILYPANYIQGKGQEYALECFASIYKKYPQWKLRFVGGDMGLQKNRDFKAGLIEKAKAFGMEDQVEWYGFSEDIAREYLNASIVLNFSESESFSLTCLEGMFYGRPVIATKSGGPSEIIDDQVAGILVELRDTNAMTKALEYLITHSLEREAMGRLAYSIVRQKFSSANTTEKLESVYREVIGVNGV